MNFNNFLKSLFGDKSSRDMKLIQPLVEKVKAEYPKIKALTNDELRAKTKELQHYVQSSADEQKKQIEELKAKKKMLVKTKQIQVNPYEETKTGQIKWTGTVESIEVVKGQEAKVFDDLFKVE